MKEELNRIKRTNKILYTTAIFVNIGGVVINIIQYIKTNQYGYVVGSLGLFVSLMWLYLLFHMSKKRDYWFNQYFELMKGTIERSKSYFLNNEKDNIM